MKLFLMNCVAGVDRNFQYRSGVGGACSADVVPVGLSSTLFVAPVLKVNCTFQHQYTVLERR
jgi:hypothetical protein